MAVDETLKAASIERRIELVGELQVVAAVGDEDAKLTPVGRVGSARLPGSAKPDRMRHARRLPLRGSNPCRLMANISTSVQCA